MPTVYVASKARHHAWSRALRAAGAPIVSSWVDWPHNVDGTAPTADAWSRHWQQCIDQAADADVLLFVAFEDERQCGALIELGAALASGKKCYVVSPHWWSVSHHPRCRIFPTIEAAVVAIMASCAGETARRVKIAEAR